MVQGNGNRVNPETHGTIDLGGQAWVVCDTGGVLVGRVPLTGDANVDEYGQALALLGLTRPFRLNKALESMQAREGWDDHSPWGSAMQLLGNLCDVASVLGGKIPESAGYWPAMGLRTVDDLDTSENTGDAAVGYLLRDIESGLVSLHDVELAIRILDRYLDLPQVAAGRY